jgi:hypothetical protein
MMWFSQPRIVWLLTVDSEEEMKTLQLRGIVQFTKKKQKKTGEICLCSPICQLNCQCNLCLADCRLLL